MKTRDLKKLYKRYPGPIGYGATEEVLERINHSVIGKRLDSYPYALEWCNENGFDCSSHALSEGYTEQQLINEYTRLEYREADRHEDDTDHWW